MLNFDQDLCRTCNRDLTYRSFFLVRALGNVLICCLLWWMMTSVLNWLIASMMKAQSQKKRKLFGQQDFPCKNFPDRTCNRDIVKFATKVLKTAILIAMSHERKNLNLYLAKYIFTQENTFLDTFQIIWTLFRSSGHFRIFWTLFISLGHFSDHLQTYIYSLTVWLKVYDEAKAALYEINQDQKT